MGDRLSNFIEVLKAISDGKWVNLKSVLERLPIPISMSDLLELSRRGIIDSYVDLTSGEIYIKVERDKPIGSNGNNGLNLTEVIEQIKAELREPMPKPAFEDLLRRITGDEWSRVYTELINRGIIKEIDFNGIVFLALTKTSDGNQ